MLMLDYDPNPNGKPLSRDELIQTLYDVCPALKEAPLIYRPSASSCIYNNQNDVELRGIRGKRLYLSITEANDIPRAGDVLFKRLWLKGYGHIDISNAGSLLVRSFIDAAVWQPERLDFCGGADCEPPLEQHLPEPEVYNEDAPYLDTKNALPNLTADEERQYQEFVNSAKKEKKVEADRIKKQRIQGLTEEKAAKLPTSMSEADREKTIEKIEETMRAAIEGGTLEGDYDIYMQNNQKVTIQEILNNPNKYHGKRCADPVEPEYRNDHRIGWINTKAVKPYIYSHAHGGRRFELQNERSKILLRDGDRFKTVSKVLNELRKDSSVYQYGASSASTLVQIRNQGEIVQLDREEMLLLLDQKFLFERFDKRSQKNIPKDCPIPIAQGVLACRGQWGLPVLKSISTAPTMDPKSNRIMDKDGYDPTTGILVIKNDMTDWPHIPEHPTTQQAREALERIWIPFKYFPFVSAVDRGVFLSFVLLTSIRSALPTAPGLLINSPTPGSGKTLMSVCLAVLSGMESPGILPKPDREEEMRKRLLALGLKNVPTILIDNISTDLESESLCAFLTSEYYEDRILGSSKNVTVSSRSIFVGTGNNVTLQGDLCRRVLTTRVDAGVEDPWNRKFSLDPKQYCLENRVSLISDALTILKWANNNEYELLTRTGSYEIWSDTIRKAVCMVGHEGWIDVDDPVISIESSYTQDKDMQRLQDLSKTWFELFKDAPMTLKEAVQEARRNKDTSEDQDGLYEMLFENMDEIAGAPDDKINTRSLGKWLTLMRGRPVKGLAFQYGSYRHKTVAWRVVRQENSS